MASRKHKSKSTDKNKPTKRKRSQSKPVPIQQHMGIANPRTPHPRDIDQPTDHDFNIKDLGEKKEGENFDKFEVEAEVRRRGGATCQSVLIMKHNKPLPMWFDEFLCPRVMPGKWCGYVAYAFRRRIRFGSWPTWHDVPQDVKDEAWADILASWDFRTALTEDEHADLRKLWTTYASDRKRNWRTHVARRYIWEVDEEEDIGHPCEQYRWMDPNEWDLFVSYRKSEEFAILRKIGKENAEKKEYIQTTGSAGYRKIIIEKGKEKKNEEVDKKMEAGMTRREAEACIVNLSFKVDRSIVFVEGNRSRKTGEIKQQFVRDLEPEILKMNKDKDAGKLKFKGKEDILIRLTKKQDHGGRYRGCPGTAKMLQALPDYYAEKMRRTRCHRDRKTSSATDRGSQDAKDGVEMATLERFTDFLSSHLGIQLPENFTPREFLEQQQPKHATSPSDDGSRSSNDEEPIPCYLNIQDSCGTIKRAAAGVVINRPQHVPPQPASECVKIRPPILLPGARLPYYDLNYKTVSAAVGAAINWPEEYIDYEGREQTAKVKPRKVEDEKGAETGFDSGSESRSQSGSDSGSRSGSESGSESGSQSHAKSNAKSDETDGSEPESKIPKFSPSMCTPSPNVNWEFAHHVQDPSLRKGVLDFLGEMKSDSNGRDVYRVKVGPDVFGPMHQKVNLIIQEALTWIISCSSGRKEWIRGWQMDMWGSCLFSKLPKEDIGRVQLISTSSSFSTYTNANDGKNKVVNGIIDLMTEKPARLYVMPSCRDAHWMLFLIYPEESVVYCIDSNSNGVANKKKFEYDLLMRLGAAYDANIRSKTMSSEDPKEWKIQNIKHKHQPFNWECGYYCMLYMEKIMLLNSGVDVQQIFPQDFDAYPMPIIEGLIDSFCRHVLKKVAPECRLQNVTKKKKERGSQSPSS